MFLSVGMRFQLLVWSYVVRGPTGDELHGGGRGRSNNFPLGSKGEPRQICLAVEAFPFS